MKLYVPLLGSPQQWELVVSGFEVSPITAPVPTTTGNN